MLATIKPVPPTKLTITLKTALPAVKGEVTTTPYGTAARTKHKISATNSFLTFLRIITRPLSLSSRQLSHPQVRSRWNYTKTVSWFLKSAQRVPLRPPSRRSLPGPSPAEGGSPPCCLATSTSKSPKAQKWLWTT